MKKFFEPSHTRKNFQLSLTKNDKMWYDSCMKSDDYRVLICIVSMIESQLSTRELDIAKWLAWPGERVSEALDSLIRQSWIVCVDNQLYPTTEGASVADSVHTYIHVTDPRKVDEFKRKALAGEIDGIVALPRGRMHRTKNTQETAVLTALERKAISSITGLDFDEIGDAIAEGRIRFCPRCRRHNLFWKDSRTSSGWKSVCKDCC